ncbi:MAG: hypothetical protein JWO09_2440 [Bacteroidetes bacterium]|nr:hypothetical protein [Bacteroidota bacterium]
MLLLLILAGCKAAGTKMIMLEASPEVEVTVNSACRNSAILPLKDEAGLKSALRSHSSAAMKRLKLKTTAKEAKSTFTTTKIELAIYETCQGKSDNNPPPVRLHEKLTLQHTKTKEMYVFEMDTLINNQKLNPNQLAVPKVDYEAYLLPVTQLAYQKAKTFFSRKK